MHLSCAVGWFVAWSFFFSTTRSIIPQTCSKAFQRHLWGSRSKNMQGPAEMLQKWLNDVLESCGMVVSKVVFKVLGSINRNGETFRIHHRMVRCFHSPIHTLFMAVLICFLPSWNQKITPRKTNMKTENHPFEKEKHLNLNFFLGGSMSNFGRCMWSNSPDLSRLKSGVGGGSFGRPGPPCWAPEPLLGIPDSVSWFFNINGGLINDLSLIRFLYILNWLYFHSLSKLVYCMKFMGAVIIHVGTRAVSGSALKWTCASRLMFMQWIKINLRDIILSLHYPCVFW